MMSMFNLVTSACLVLVNSVHCERREVHSTCSHVNVSRLNLSKLVLRDTTVRLRVVDVKIMEAVDNNLKKVDMVRCGEENSPGRAPPACSRWRGREEGSGFRCP